MAKPTFKIHRPTGKYRSFELPHVDIKLNKKKCGSITPDGRFTTSANGYCVMLAVKDATSRFKWVTFKARFNEFDSHTSIENAKQWVVENWSKLTADRDLFFFED